ncbi:MAG: hypothetical protein KAR22_27770 [Gammaproteobacteria bacterium]|nr:hypothetical protein [Gammaproteobacteria bacterium]
MTQQATFVEESIDRVQNAVRSFEGEFEKLQKEFGKRRKQFRRDTQKQVKKIRADLRGRPLVKRAESLRSDAAKQLDSGVDSVLSLLRIASRSDVEKLDRKLGQINRKLNQMEKGGRHTGGSA